MAAMVNMNSLLNGKDSRWLQLEVCREFQRNKCSRQDTECKFAHPPANVEVQNGKVTACYDSIKGRCNRDKPPCKYFHPPQHLKDQLLINGRNHLALKNALMQQMGIAPGQPVMPGQVQTVATNPYLTGIPANTYSPYFGPGHLVPAILGPDPSAVASQLGPVVSQAVPVAQQKIPRSDRLEVCREFMRSACKRAESECRFAHPQESVTTHEDGSVTVCMDAVKGRCARDPCRYFHPPLHLQAQIKAAQSRATATAPVSAATLTHPIQTPGAAPPPNAVAIGHPLEVGKKRAAENDMFQLAFSGMVPFKRPAGEKSGIPVYQPGATTYQQLMQLQQPFVPVSCEYQSQNPSATTANPQPQTSNTANPIIANNSSNNHSIINNNFIFNNLNHLKNNSKISQVNLNTVHNNMASNGMLSISNLNSSTGMIPSSTKISDVVATKIIQSNSSNGGVVNSTNGIICSVNNNNIGSNTSDSSLVSNLTNKAIQDSIPSTLTAQTQSSINNALASTFVSNSPTTSTATTLATSDSTQTNSVNISTTTSSPSTQTMLSQSNLNADSPILNGENTAALTDGGLIENATNTDTSLNPTISAEASSTVITDGSSLINATSFNNTDTPSNISMTTAFPTSTEQHLKPNLTKYEPQNNNQSITTVASSADISYSVQNSASISFPTSTQSRIYSTPHSYGNVIVSHHGYTPVSSVTSSAIPITYSSAPSTYNYTSFPTQSYSTQSYQAQCYPTNSYYADPASIAKEVAQKNYANAVKMAAASNALSGKPLTAAINYTGLPLNKTYVTPNPGAVAFSHHHQQQQAAAVAAAQAVQVAGLRMNSHGVGGSLGTAGPGPSSTPSLLPRPPTGFLPASSMMRTQPISMSTAAASNPYAAAAAAAAAANQQYLHHHQQQQQQQQHYFFPGMMAGYPYQLAAPGVPGLASASGIHGMPAQIQAAQMAQMNQAAAAAAQLLDTLPVCQDFNRSMCSRLNCRFVHLTEDDKVEVCDQRVAVCRDHANGQCRRKLCKYYHIPVVLPPANIMATIFNQQPAQQPLHHPNPLGAATTISLNEQKQQEQLKQQQLIITTNASSGTAYTSISSHHNNNILSSLSNNTIYKNINEKKNTLAPYQPKTLSPTTLLRQVTSSTSKPLTPQQNFASASPQSPKSISEPSNIYALTTSTSTMSTPVMTTSSNLSTAAIAHVYTPTFEGYFNAQQHLAPAFGYYDILNQGVSNSDSHRISVLSSNPTYIAAPLIYTSKSVSQTQHHDTSGETNTPNANISKQHQHHSSVSNPPEIITTSTI